MKQGALFGDVTHPRLQWLGPDCALAREGDMLCVVVAGSPLLRMAADDDVEKRAASALIAEGRLAPVGAVQRALGVDDSTLWRARQRLRKGGVTALASRKRGPKGASKVGDALIRRMVELRRTGLSRKAIGLRLGLSAGTVQRYLAREGVPLDEGTINLPFAPPESEERTTTPSEVAPSEVGAAPSKEEPEAVLIAPADIPAVVVQVGEVTTIQAPEGAVEAEVLESPSSQARVIAEGPSADERLHAPTQEVAVLRAMLGATPEGESEVVFEPREHVPFAGLLLVIPALAATGLLEAARSTYGRLRRAVYGLRATILTLGFLAFLRRPRPEALKGIDPGTFGDVLGLLRTPEVKTVRRKLREINELKKSHEFMTSLAGRWLKERDDSLGVLYIDGHVRAYDGQRKLPKAHVTQKNMCLPATTDYWVNAADGQPLFVITAKANAAMTKILPDLLAQIEKANGGRKGTVVFDRGGWSTTIFKAIVAQGWHFITYRKGKKRKHPRNAFRTHRATIDGREVKYELSQRRIRLKNGLKLREIAELRDDGGQTLVVTSHFKHRAVLLAHRMFQRWRQENYFQYMKQNFALDALVDYDVEPDDPTREIPNPARKKLDVKIADARTQLVELEREYGAAAADNVEAERPTTRGFKIANGKLGKALRAARERVARLVARRKTVPQRVAVGSVFTPDQVVRLSPERKLFTDMIKSAVYRAETAMLTLLRPHFRRADDEGRAFLREAVRQPGELVVHGNELVVRLSPMSAPRFTAALRALCAELNAIAPCFPETRYRLRYEVQAEDA